MFRLPFWRRNPEGELDESHAPGQPAAISRLGQRKPPDRLLSIQQRVGNRAMGHFLRQVNAQGSDGARAAQARLGQGRPLDSDVRARMQPALGHDLSQVRVHDDAAAAALARQKGAHALTVGEDIVFNAGNYQPGTPLGDALIAHELAHVVQQSNTAQGPMPVQAIGAADASLEQDADRTARGVVGSLWSGLKGVGRGVAAASSRARPAMRTTLGVQMFICSGSRRKIEAPDFLGPRSRETFDIIRHRIESANLLENMLIAGPLIILLTTPVRETAAGGGYPLKEQVEAVRAVDVIFRNRVMQDIDLLLVMHGDELTEEERQYWERLRTVLTAAGRQ